MPGSRVLPLDFGVGGKLLSLPFEVEIFRSCRKTLTLYIKNGKLVVRCPNRATRHEIDRFISDNTAWIEQQLQEEAQRERELLRIEQGAGIFFRARELSIEFRESRKPGILVEADRFIISGRRLNPAKARNLLRDDLIGQAGKYLIPRARGLARHLGVEHKISEIKLRKTRTRWGHCTTEGVLQYNWLIMLAPYSIIDYMITHEVCHLVHMNHSREFWRLVESVCPGHKVYVDWLEEHEHRLWF